MADNEFDLERFRQQAILVHEFLNQDIWWVDVHQRRHAIRDMSVRYKANCLAFMRKRVGYFAARYAWGAVWAMQLPSGFVQVNSQGEDRAGLGRPVTRGDMFLDDGGNMSHAFDQYIDDLQKRIDRDPVSWLDDTPLMKALSDQVLAGEGGAIGERAEDEPREADWREECPRCSAWVSNYSQHRRAGNLARLCTGEWVRLSSPLPRVR
jgi:hypothetical protein